MIYCSLNLDKTRDAGKTGDLICYGIGTFSVFSGIDPYTNKAGCSGIDKGSIPTGKYWIVARPTGGLRSKMRTAIQDWWTGNDHSTWFALYRQDGVMDDWTFINGIKRGNFRLHPNRPDGQGESWGCITFYNPTEFSILRNRLLRTQQVHIRGSSGLMAYGQVTVTGNSEANCDV
ncbi:DUF2778 domain-containing protein [Serratia rhizosphaerae]|uniref:DUF2778 domain-containing protein n=1 Tax=Serratia sp. Tan611 TaxID=2773264 RepID=UPI0018D99CC0|nr:DUF2778 domain-containing protein [Serratia sp. Tan611]MBU3894084.1 DUF2778 domain-containing protein [Serratia rubidaea]QPT14719.1 DUF2778 domain-containing protein [Serratia rubidaea]CAE1143649.1 conserved protein of unknown function [Serratia sp. Tan611]